MRYAILALAFVVGTSGCAGMTLSEDYLRGYCKHATPEKCQAKRQEAVRKSAAIWAEKTDTDACIDLSRTSYGTFRQAGIDELTKRRLLRKKYLTDIYARQIRMGMNVCELAALMGRPLDVNTTQTRWGRHDQLVFRGSGQYERRYVYLEDGVVTSWQF